LLVMMLSVHDVALTKNRSRKEAVRPLARSQ